MSTNTPPRTKRGFSQEDMGGLGSEREVSGETMHGVLARAEIDQQIATAKAWPRKLQKFLNECMEMATLNEQVASECIYAVPREGKTIEGPSARLAEIVASAWGNCRAGARVVDEGPEFITAQGVFHDLEKNVAITYEVRRRITGKNGNRFSSDMIAVTGNAASSIALRNAVFKGIPKALWSGIYDAARKVVAGNSQTLANRRSAALQHMQKLGATPAMVCAFLKVASEQEITLDHLTTLRGIANAIRDEEVTVEEAFAPKQAEPAKVDLGDIPLEPKPKAAPSTAAKPTIERPAVEELLERATEAEIRIEHVFAQAAKLSGRKVESTRDLATLDDATLTTLANEIAAFGPEPEATR